MSFWEKLKNWKNYVIGWLGGYSAEEVKMIELTYRKKVEAKGTQIHKWICVIEKVAQERNDIMRQRDEKRKCVEGLRTAQAEEDYPVGVDYDAIKYVNKDSIVRQLGEAVYPYAQHFYLPDGRYIVAVTVATEGEHGGE